MFGAIGRSVKREFASSPIATTVTLFGAFAGLFAFFLTPSLRFNTVISPSEQSVSIAHLVGAFGVIGIATIFASFSRIAFGLAKLPSFLISILLAALGILISSVFLASLGVGFPLSLPQKYSTDKLVFYSHVFIF